MKLIGTEVFINLKKIRNFKNNVIIFDDKTLSVEISFNSDNLETFKNTILCYGFRDTAENYGSDYDIFLNENKINAYDFDFVNLKKYDKIRIYYNDFNCFSLYLHIIIHEVDKNHDDEFYLRKELEK